MSIQRSIIRPSTRDKIYSVAKIAAVVDSLRAEGVEPSRSLKGIHLSESELHSPEARVSLEQVVGCFHNAVRLCSNRDFAYRTGLRFHVSTYGMYGFAIFSSTAFRQACRFAEQYHQLETPVADITFSEEDDHGVWTVTPALLRDIDARLYEFIVELQFGITVSLHRDVMGPAFTPREFCLTYGAAHPGKTLEKLFGCPVRSSRPKNAIVFDRKWLEGSPEFGNELSHLEAVRLCDQLLREMKERIGLGGEVRQVLLHNIARNLTIDAVAKRLDIPVRSLKRKLHQEETSYRQIAIELKSQIAERYLRDTHLTIEEIAYCLGYSEAAGFRQAFRRWTKKSPQEFRNVGNGRRS